MALPNEATIRTAIGNVIWLFENMRKYGHVNSENFVENYESALDGLAADTAPAAASALNSLRSQFAGGLTQQSVRNVLDPLFLTYGRVKGYPETDAGAIISRLFVDFDDDSDSVQSSEIAFGTVSAGGSNVGGGTINRCTVDRWGYEIENRIPTTYTIKCVKDEHSGAREHEEEFEVRDAAATRDAIQLSSRGNTSTMKGASSATSILRNASFDDGGGTDASLAAGNISGWTMSAAGSFQRDTNNTYRAPVGVTQPKSLQIDATANIAQNFNVANLQLSRSRPYYAQVAWKADAGTAGVGTLVLQVGSVTESVAVSGQTGWQVLRIPLGQKNWFEFFNQEDPEFKISWTRTSGDILVDDCIFQEMVPFDGLWHLPVGDATPFLVDDLFTFADTATDSGVIQHWLRRAYGRYLPHSGTPTWADPT